jgi:hypothetical protein
VKFVSEPNRKRIDNPTPLPPARRLAHIAVADIGAVAVRLLEDPGRFAGRRFDLAGDDLAGNDVVASLSRITARHLLARSRWTSSASAWVRTVGHDGPSSRTGASKRFLEVRALADEVQLTRARLEIVAFVSNYGHALPLYRAVTSLAVSARL